MDPSKSATMKILGLRWSQKDKITLEAIRFWRNISISIFKFSSVLCIIEAINETFSIFQNLQMLWLKKRKNDHTAVNEKRKTEKSYILCSLNDCFTKSFKSIINHFFFILHGNQNGARNIKRENLERRIARNGKLQYLFQK